MATTKIIIATVPKSDKMRTLNMLQTSRKTEILQQMAAAADARLGLQPTKHTLTFVEESEIESQAPRKRQRLTHLTQEEKMNRRKLKNRVAAQTARDRKKAQVDDMEANMAIVQARNKQLQLENALLRRQNQSLSEENQQLKARLEEKTEETSSVVVLDHGYCMDTTTGTPATTTATTTVPSSEHHPVKQEVDIGPPESAALNAPPQQELARLFLSFLAMMLTWSLTTSYLACLASSTKSPPAGPFSSASAGAPWNRQAEEPLCLVTRKGKRDGSQSWWGPQQRSWNPSKN